MASQEGLEGLLVLPEMSQDQVKRLSTLVAAHMSMCLDAACGDLFVSEDVKPEEIRQAWERVAAEAMRLELIPPAFEQLRRKKRRCKPVPYELIPPSLARMLCADWWYRKLWQMRCEWREEQLRAVCLVNKKASPYVSYEAVIHKREQRRKSLEFFRSHELVNEDGDTLDMEDVVNASNSNPAPRRNEMLACVKDIRIYGIWSPIVEGKICTHAMKWKKVRKAVAVQEAAADQGTCAPWTRTRGNNCPLLKI